MRLLSIINNLGVGAEILGMLVFAVILLIFFNHQPLSVLTNDGRARESQPGGSYLPMFVVAMFMSPVRRLRLRHRRHVRRGDA